MPEPLVCEDTSLTRLMETVHETPGARILYQDTVRRGGVMGFFAREVHRVAYIGAGETVEIPGLTFETATAPAAAPSAGSYDDDLMMLADLVSETPRSTPTTTLPRIELPRVAPTIDFAPVQPTETASDELGFSAFAALLAQADADEIATIEADPDEGRHFGTGGIDFARILERYTEDEATTGQLSADNIDTISIVPDFGTAADDAPLADITPINGKGSQARNRLELLVQLRELGVPVGVNPGVEARDLYQALEEILDQLPEPAGLPDRPGQLLAIVGEAGPALRAARATAKLLRLSAADIVVAGLDQDEAGDLRRINGRRQAARLRQEIEESDLPAIVVVATDVAGPHDPADTWTTDLLAALRADRTWAVIDARWKPEDCHGLLDRLGPVQALVVHAAELSASPASVWELDLPLALLDDRRPSTFVWLSLLSRLLGSNRAGAVQAHRATA